MVIPYEGSAGPIGPSIDSTGIKAEGDGNGSGWQHRGLKWRLWRKMVIDFVEETTNMSRNEFTICRTGDSPILGGLLTQIVPDQELGSVMADGANDTCKYHDAIVARDARAVISLRRSGKLWKSETSKLRARNYAVRASRI